MPHDTTLTVAPGDDLAPPRVEVDGSRFRVRTAQFSTPWLPDTPSHRHRTLVWCRLLVEAHGPPLCTLQEWAVIVGSPHRPAASQHREDLRQCGEAMRAFVLRQRTVDPTVVAGVVHELLQTPWAGPPELGPRVQARLGRDDLTVAHSACAREQISCVPVLRTLRRQLETGHGHDHEAWRLTEVRAHRSLPAPRLVGWHGPSTDRGMQVAAPTALAALGTPALPRAQVPGSLCWLTCLMPLLYWHVPLAVLSRWCGVQKTTIWRWVVGLALALWPLLSHWRLVRVKAQRVSVEEKWLTIRGRWPAGFVVVDVATARPVLAALRPSRSPWACRWLGRQWRLRKPVPQVLITDGWPASAAMGPGAKHVLCHLHHQQSVPHWLQQHCTTEEESTTRQRVRKQVLQPHAKRTVRRRLARLREPAPAWGITTWITKVETKLPQLLCSVGRARLPATTHALERFCRAFQRFYATRGGFHAVLSGTRERRLFLVVSVFTPHATTGHAPIEVVMPEARSMPLDRLSNAPFRALQERGDVKRETEMADVLRPQEAAA